MVHTNTALANYRFALSVEPKNKGAHEAATNASQAQRSEKTNLTCPQHGA